MKAYEVTYYLSSQTSSEEAQKKSAAVAELVQQVGGTIVQQTNPVAKPLAYPIKKNASGFFVTVEFQAEPEAVKTIEDSLEKDAQVLRHLLLIKKPLKQKPVRERKPKPTDEAKEAAPEITKDEKQEEKKVDIKDIEEQLDQILGE